MLVPVEEAHVSFANDEDIVPSSDSSGTVRQRRGQHNNYWKHMLNGLFEVSRDDIALQTGLWVKRAAIAPSL